MELVPTVKGSFSSAHPLNSNFEILTTSVNKYLECDLKAYFIKTKSSILAVGNTAAGLQIYKINLLSGEATAYSKIFNDVNTFKNDVIGDELWRYYPSNQVSERVGDFYAGAIGSGIRNIELEENYLVMQARIDNTSGEEPIIYYPKTGFFEQMCDIHVGAQSSNSHSFFSFGNSVFFGAESASEGQELRSYNLLTKSLTTYEFKDGPENSFSYLSKAVVNGRLYIGIDGDLVRLK